MAPYTAVAFFTNEESKTEFTKALNKLISFVENEEPDTLVYWFLEDKGNPLGMTGYEVWNCETKPFKEFVEACLNKDPENVRLFSFVTPLYPIFRLSLSLFLYSSIKDHMSRGKS